MTWYDDVNPAVVLREAARLISIDGWDPMLGTDTLREPRNGRFYRESTLTGAILRAYRCVRASWMVMVRAGEALQRVLGVRDDAGVRRWEREPGRTAERAERALLRAAYQLENGMTA